MGIKDMTLCRYTCEKCETSVDKIVEAGKQVEDRPSGWGFKTFAHIVTRYGDSPYKSFGEALCCDTCMLVSFENEWEYVEEHGWPEYEKAYCDWVDANPHRFADPDEAKRLARKSDVPPAKIDMYATANRSSVNVVQSNHFGTYVYTEDGAIPVKDVDFTWTHDEIKKKVLGT